MPSPAKKSASAGFREEPSQENFLNEYTPAHRRLLGYLISILGNRHDAEDVLQRASITMWQKFDQFEPGTCFFAWASTICFYSARNFQRLACNTRLRFDDDLIALIADERVAQQNDDEPRREALTTCMASLSESNRALLTAVYLDNADIRELACQAGRAPQTFYNRLNTLRRQLAHCVDEKLTCHPST
ncbi:MAG: sigma-70 family RNA polymerase sigma factor [Akkermansiaceae bacterium]|jgi:RNA polymerase sigma-70 factor (ECF subfamily)|nr:sigma-70 family RNA polymerase sigma factor [Akkermansiaceae bacterium]